MTRELDHLVGALFEGILTPEKLPAVLPTLAAWLAQAPNDDLADSLPALPPLYCPHAMGRAAEALPCQGSQPMRGISQAVAMDCAGCSLFDGRQLNWHRVLELVLHCRAQREFADKLLSHAQASHAAAFYLARNGAVLGCDRRAESFLKSGDVLRLANGLLNCAEQKLQPAFNVALAEAVDAGRPKSILIHRYAQPERRFSLSLTPMEDHQSLTSVGAPNGAANILCLVAPLDGRRMATARQLMDLFGLSAAEARLARAICHGSSVEEFARDQDVRLSTVRTQLSAVLHKTGTERQSGLVRLIAGIPVIRDMA